MKKIIRTTYQTSCGGYEYETEEECLEHEKISFDLDSIMSDLKWFKSDENLKENENKFYNSKNYIQQDINSFVDVRQRVLEYLYNLTNDEEFKVAFDSNNYFKINFDHLLHILEWTKFRWTATYLFRLMNVDVDGKEYPTLYEVLNIDKYEHKEIKI